jgi:hypothetical protein
MSSTVHGFLENTLSLIRPSPSLAGLSSPKLKQNVTKISSSQIAAKSSFHYINKNSHR